MRERLSSDGAVELKMRAAYPFLSPADVGGASTERANWIRFVGFLALLIRRVARFFLLL